MGENLLTNDLQSAYNDNNLVKGFEGNKYSFVERTESNRWMRGAREADAADMCAGHKGFSRNGNVSPGEFPFGEGLTLHVMQSITHIAGPS